MSKRLPGKGRPSKGDRDLMATRLLADTATQVRDLAELYDWTYSDTLAALIAIGLSHTDELPPAPSVEQQEELPLAPAV